MRSREEVQKEIQSNSLLKATLDAVLENADRYKGEPYFAKTGRGYLKSEGVEELARIKKETRGEVQKQ